MEIERKFLVDKLKLNNSQFFNPRKITQVYLGNKPTLRVRKIAEYPVTIQSSEEYFLTIKGDGLISREELETKITEDFYNQIINSKLIIGNIIEKIRYLYNYNNYLWEIDVFCGKYNGLIIAEIELNDENEQFEKPDFILNEVSLDKRYTNISMALNEPNFIF